MRILIAEDEVGIAKALKLVLEKNRFAVDMVHNGLDALEYMLSVSYDAVVLDIMMPGLDGLEVLKRAREKGVPALCVTANQFIRTARQAIFQRSQEDLDALYETELLLLDDLGTEFVTPYFITTFYSLLNNRLGAGLPTIVTTNITDGSLLEKRYTEKISSRLSAFVPFNFVGEDIRAQKASE